MQATCSCSRRCNKGYEGSTFIRYGWQLVKQKGNLSKLIEIAHATHPPDTVHTIESVNTKCRSIGRLEDKKSWIFSGIQSPMSQPCTVNAQNFEKRKFSCVISWKKNIQGYRPKTRKTKSKVQTRTFSTLTFHWDEIRTPFIWNGRLSPNKKAKHRIDLLDENSQSVYLVAIWARIKASGFLWTKTERMLAQVLIQPAQTEWESPVVLAWKKWNVGFRVNHCNHNAVNKKEFHLVPSMNKCFDTIREESVFASVDKNIRNRRVEVEESDFDESTSKSLQGQFCLVRMLFRLFNAFHTFQHTLGAILPAIEWQFTLVL